MVEIVYENDSPDQVVVVWLNRDKIRIEPDKPCSAMCGSDDKIELLSARFASGMPLYDEHDNNGMVDRW